MIEVNYKESLSKSRLVFEEGILAKFGWTFFVLTLLGTMIFYLFIMIMEYNEHEKTANNISVTILVVTVILGLLSLITKNLLTMTKLTSIIGLDSIQNRKLAFKILNEMGVKIVINRKDYLIGLVGNTMTNWGHQITVLYENDTLHINSITFDRFGGRSPFNIWSDGMNVNSFKKKFEKEIKNYSS